MDDKESGLLDKWWNQTKWTDLGKKFNRLDYDYIWEKKKLSRLPSTYCKYDGITTPTTIQYQYILSNCNTACLNMHILQASLIWHGLNLRH